LKSDQVSLPSTVNEIATLPSSDSVDEGDSSASVLPPSPPAEETVPIAVSAEVEHNKAKTQQGIQAPPNDTHSVFLRERGIVTSLGKEVCSVPPEKHLPQVITQLKHATQSSPMIDTEVTAAGSSLHSLGATNMVPKHICINTKSCKVKTGSSSMFYLKHHKIFVLFLLLTQYLFGKHYFVFFDL
jgi:hypothetical protein